MLKSILGIYVAASVGCNNFNPSECGCEATNQADYRGTINITSSGLTCQNWDTQYPNKHDFKPGSPEYKDMDLRENYCRNPDGSKAPWCITTTLSRDWCDIPICDERTATRNLSVKNQKDGGYGSVRNSISIKSQSDGVYRSDNTYYNISAKGNTSEPLSEGDYISVKLDGRWVKTKFTQDGSWTFTNSTERKVGIKAEAEIAIFGSEGDVVSYKKLYFDGSRAQHIITIEKSYIKNRVAAKGKTNSPLRDGDKIKVYFGSNWSDIDFNSEGRWNFDTTVYTGFTEVLVGIFNRNDVRLTSKRIFWEGSGGSGNTNGNEIYIKGSHHGQSLSNTTYTNLQVHGMIKKELEPLQSLAVYVEGKWIRCHVHRTYADDQETHWFWVDKKVRTKGENLKIVFGLFDRQSQLILKSDSVSIDGSQANEVINVNEGRGKRISNTDYKDNSLKGKLASQMRSDQKLISVEGNQYSEIKVNGDTWEIKYSTVKKVGEVTPTYIQISSRATNQVIAEYISLPNGENARNPVTSSSYNTGGPTLVLDGKCIGGKSCEGGLVNGKTEFKLTPGQYLTCIIDGRDPVSALTTGESENYWRCESPFLRPSGYGSIRANIVHNGVVNDTWLIYLNGSIASNSISMKLGKDGVLRGQLAKNLEKSRYIKHSLSMYSSLNNAFNGVSMENERNFHVDIKRIRGGVQTTGEYLLLSYSPTQRGYPYTQVWYPTVYAELYY